MAGVTRKAQAADDFNDRRICINAVRAWWGAAEKELHMRRIREKRAQNHWARYVVERPSKTTFGGMLCRGLKDLPYVEILSEFNGGFLKVK